MSVLMSSINDDPFVIDLKQSIATWTSRYDNYKDNYNKESIKNVIEALNLNTKNIPFSNVYHKSPGYSQLIDRIKKIDLSEEKNLYQSITDILIEFQEEIVKTTTEQKEILCTYIYDVIDALRNPTTKLLKNQRKILKNGKRIPEKELIELINNIINSGDISPVLEFFDKFKWFELKDLFENITNYFKDLDATYGELSDEIKNLDSLKEKEEKSIETRRLLRLDIGELKIECVPIGKYHFQFPEAFGKHIDPNKFIDCLQRIKHEKPGTLKSKAKRRIEELSKELSKLEESFLEKEAQNEFAFEILINHSHEVFQKSQDKNECKVILAQGFLALSDYLQSDYDETDDIKFVELKEFCCLLKDQAV